MELRGNIESPDLWPNFCKSNIAAVLVFGSLEAYEMSRSDVCYGRPICGT